MINATDPEGVPLRYSFKSVSALFQPNPTTGEVTVKSPLDREVSLWATTFIWEQSLNFTKPSVVIDFILCVLMLF